MNKRCNDCKYIFWLTTHDSGYNDGCWACKATETHPGFYGDPKELNKNGYCKYYRRRWYKIWR